jgi:hypothetical protein
MGAEHPATVKTPPAVVATEGVYAGQAYYKECWATFSRYVSSARQLVGEMDGQLSCGNLRAASNVQPPGLPPRKRWQG